jgi:hypothetical protein
VRNEGIPGWATGRQSSPVTAYPLSMHCHSNERLRLVREEHRMRMDVVHASAIIHGMITTMPVSSTGQDPQLASRKYPKSSWSSAAPVD